MPVAAGGTACTALLIEFLIYKRLRRGGAGAVVLAMSSLGVAIILRSVTYLIWGPQPRYYVHAIQPALQLPFDIKIKPDEIFIVCLAFVLVVALYLFLNRTKMGKAMRATADNVELARITGIDTGRVISWTWGIGAALAAIAGILYGLEAQLLPIMGWTFLIPLFAAAILGGIGNPYGALAGAMVVGISQQVSTAFISPAYKPAVAFIIMIIILLVRPRGIFGSKG